MAKDDSAPKTSPTGAGSGKPSAAGSATAATGASDAEPAEDPDVVRRRAIADDIRSAAPASADPNECLAIAENVAGGAYESGQGDLAGDLAGVGCPEGDRRAICRRVGVSTEPVPPPPPDAPALAAGE